jgi:rSAM/selenodomain-associated transferase 1
MVIAKAPVAGRSKTRLCPPCSPVQAAELAEAALADTLEAVAATTCGGRTLVLDGPPGDWLPPGFDVVPQVEGDLGLRLADAFSTVEGKALLIGMDTPQVTPDLLEVAIDRLREESTDGVLGLCFDGGYWAIGFDGQRTGVFQGVPMSEETTGERQLARMRQLDMSVAELPVLADVDFYEDALGVAAGMSGGRFAKALARMEPADA